MPRRREVWLFDFGLAGKVRPALVISVAPSDEDRALVSVVPHTTSLRGSQYEIAVPASFLKAGAFLVQGITTFPSVQAKHRLGVLGHAEFELVTAGLLKWLGQSPES